MDTSLRFSCLNRRKILGAVVLQILHILFFIFTIGSMIFQMPISDAAQRSKLGPDLDFDLSMDVSKKIQSFNPIPLVQSSQVMGCGLEDSMTDLGCRYDNQSSIHSPLFVNPLRSPYAMPPPH